MNAKQREEVILKRLREAKRREILFRQFKPDYTLWEEWDEVREESFVHCNDTFICMFDNLNDGGNEPDCNYTVISKTPLIKFSLWEKLKMQCAYIKKWLIRKMSRGGTDKILATTRLTKWSDFDAIINAKQWSLFLSIEQSEARRREILFRKFGRREILFRRFGKYKYNEYYICMWQDGIDIKVLQNHTGCKR